MACVITGNCFVTCSLVSREKNEFTGTEVFACEQERRQENWQALECGPSWTTSKNSFLASYCIGLLPMTLGGSFVFSEKFSEYWSDKPGVKSSFLSLPSNRATCRCHWPCYMSVFRSSSRNWGLIQPWGVKEGDLSFDVSQGGRETPSQSLLKKQ